MEKKPFERNAKYFTFDSDSRSHLLQYMANWIDGNPQLALVIWDIIIDALRDEDGRYTGYIVCANL